MSYLDELNPEQKAPVLDTEGAVLVVAGAGSGKTRVLTSRIAYLLDKKNVSPANILAITFTNKAANEMRERLAKIISGGDDCWVSTIHGMCVRILRRSIDYLEGYNSNFSIYSDVDRERVLKRILGELKIDGESALKNAKFHVTNAKNNCLTPEEYLVENSRYADIDKYVRIYSLYEHELKRSNALDFDDLLVKTCKILSENKEALEYYADKFHYIHVDEFQDTNKTQYDIIKLLASKHKNVFAVGDDDQSIYGWRGAEIKNILDFNKDFKGAKVYKLEQNYRSTKRILELANAIIKNNRERSEKVLWTNNEDGPRVETYTGEDETSEAAYTAMQIKTMVRLGASYSDFAVLMRLNALSRAYEQEFAKYGIPFKIFGGFKFFERKEIKDLTAYLRILSNPFDDEAILRVINVPKRGIGAKSIETLVSYAKENGLMLFDAVFDIEKISIASSARQKISDFKKIIVSLLADREMLPLDELIDSVIKKTDFTSQFVEDTEENESRRMNVDEFKNSVEEFLHYNPNAGLNDFLSSITLATDVDDIDDGNYVSVATVHAVKGLEFNTVFIAGLDENIFPLSRAVGEPSELEEERRLMYVAITRAQRKLYITRSRSRFLYGERQNTIPSRFLSELSDKLGIKKPMKPEGGLYGSRYADDGRREPSPSYGVSSNFSSSFSRSAATLRGAASAANTGDKDFSQFYPGRKIIHPKFGQGTIVSVKNGGANSVCDVAFPGLGIKSFALAFAPIKPV